MKYIVERVSNTYNYTSPCDEAILVNKDYEIPYYFIEIESQEDLIKFINKYGKVIIKPLQKCEIMDNIKYSLIIYDSYYE